MKIEKILVDHREQFKPLKTSKYKYVVTELRKGDFIIVTDETEIAIERKQVMTGDLVQSILDGRLLNQCADMALEFDHCLLWVDGTFTEKNGKIAYYAPSSFGLPDVVEETRFPYNLLASRLFDVQLLGVPIYVNDCPLDTVIDHAVSKLVGHTIKLPVKKAVTVKKEISVLCAVHGIGPKKARDLLITYGTVSKAVAHLEREGKI